MTQTDPRPGDKSDRPAAAIAELVDVAARGNEAIRLPGSAMARLHTVRQAKSALKGLTACELRAAPGFGRQGLGGEPA